MGSAWKKEAAFLGRNEGPWFLVGGYPLHGEMGGDGEPLLRHVWLIAVLVFLDAAKDLFVETDTRALAICNHPGYQAQACACQASVEFYREQGKADEAIDADELFENAAGAEVPWADLDSAEQQYYSDTEVDKRQVTITDYLRMLAGGRTGDRG